MPSTVRFRRFAAIAVGMLWVSSSGRAAPDAHPSPYSVAPELFDQAKPDLGLAPAAGARTFTIFRAADDTDKFSNGVVLVRFKGRFYAQWQSSARDEDALDTWVACSTSVDGESWTRPHALSRASGGSAMHSSGGWWTDGAVLVAYVNVWPDGFGPGKGGHAEYRLSTDGETWSEPKRLMGHDGHPLEGIIEQDPHAYTGRLFTAFHVPPGLIAKPHYTDDPLGLSGWTMGKMPSLPAEKSTSRELEPSLFQRGPELVMVFRDQSSSYHQLAAVSSDRGVTWTTPVLTDMPDSRSKQSAGNLPDGTAFLVNAPHAGRERLPLAVTLARDGRRFDRSFRLRGPDDLPPLRYEGRYKRPGYHYPKSIVADGFLFVGYATNKEDVQVTRVPLSSLQAETSSP